MKRTINIFGLAGAFVAGFIVCLYGMMRIGDDGYGVHLIRMASRSSAILAEEASSQHRMANYYESKSKEAAENLSACQESFKVLLLERYDRDSKALKAKEQR